MKVVHVIPGLNPSSGPSQALENLCRHQVQIGVEVKVCYVSGRGAEPRANAFDGIELIDFPAKHFRAWGYAPEMKPFFRKTFAESDIVHIHSMWCYPNIAASAAAVRQNVPYIVRPAGSLESWCIANRMWKKRLYLRCISRRIMDKAAAIHAMAEQEARQIESFGFRAPVTTIPNGIDFEQLKRWQVQDHQVLTKALGWPAAKNHLLFLSRIHPKKGLEFLLDLFSQLSPERRDLRLMIAGPDDHEYARQIRGLARTSPLSGRIHFLGEVLGDRKWMSLAAATAFVLPSKSENFGIAVLESLASGTPVFVSDQTPWSIVNEEGAGACLPLDIGKFKNRLTDVLDKPEVLKRSTIAATKIASNFEWRAIAQRNLEMYERICGVYNAP